MPLDIPALLSQLTREEKAALLTGRDLNNTVAVERLGIPSILVTDGPHGLRRQPDEDWLASVPATCFPAGVSLASSWDRDLIAQVSAGLAEEFLAEGASVILGPAMNMKRTPLCGRNFEYLSEDPYLAGEMAAAYVTGAQAKGVGCCLKHFAANNQEYRRFTTNAVVAERPLHEIYLAAFEKTVRQAKPWSLMAAYNRINGVFCTENPDLLTTWLRGQWGHDGIVMSDWGAVNDRDRALAAGLDLEMPTSKGYGAQRILAALDAGTLAEATLDEAVTRFLTMVDKAMAACDPAATYDVDAHHALAADAAAQCVVLLRNDGLLPLTPSRRLAVLGAFAENPRFQGGGSSHVHATRVDAPLDAIRALAGTGVTIDYAPGYRQEEASVVNSLTNKFASLSDRPDDALVAEAVALAAQAEVAIVFAGLPESYEAEGFDREHLGLPAGHVALIEAVAAVQPNLVVVLANGSAVEMPWLGQTKAVVETYLGGQASGTAVARVLFGEVNPSGKLAETFPRRLADTPAHLGIPTDLKDVDYAEGLFIGYRHYDAKDIEPLFEFGFGLSYTTFAYSNLTLSASRLTDAETLTVRFDVTNTGDRAGAEVAQVYVADLATTIPRPVAELKGFAKLYLAPGETKTAEIILDQQAFAYWEPALGDWTVEPGAFEVRVGASSRDIRLRASVQVDSAPLPVQIDKNSTLADVVQTPAGRIFVTQILHQFADSPLLRGFVSEAGLDVDAALAYYNDITLRSLPLLSYDLGFEVVDGIVAQLNAPAGAGQN